MPTSRFVVRGDSGDAQADPIDFADLEAAQGDAVEMAGALLADQGPEFWNNGRLQLDVVDAQGVPRCTLTITGSTNSPGAEPS